ncbi:asparaginase [Anthocerotibacter panamensis]|uniref:asparaginase n=1 Tax=Anthocerotibacter panamensis TaxID=2857077 RepID=UPI001C407E12|nr:asparaginase [Anthocerotibacter panamensis]
MIRLVGPALDRSVVKQHSVLPYLLLLVLMLLGGLPITSAGAQQSQDVPPDPVTLPQVTVIGTGGTIAGVSTHKTSFQDYRASQLTIQFLVGQLPRLEYLARVDTVQFGNKSSGAYTLPELFDLSLAVDRALATADGVVVTTGTDTMEEIAYFLDLTVRSPKPVVVTGAMRPWTVIGTDAPANLYNAIRLAASGRTRSFGTVVMLNDTIQLAREATKTNSTRLDTFQSPQLGLVGYIDQERIRLYRAPARALRQSTWQTPFDLSQISREKLPRVEIVYSYQDAGGEAIDAFVQAGVAGMVTAGTGGGGISEAQQQARTRAVEKGVIFVATTRTGSGGNYNDGKNLLAGDNLNPQHARIFLLLSLAFSREVKQIRQWFQDYAAPQVELPPQLAGLTP